MDTDSFWTRICRGLGTVTVNLQLQAGGFNRNPDASVDAEGIRNARQLVAEVNALIDAIEKQGAKLSGGAAS